MKCRSCTEMTFCQDGVEKDWYSCEDENPKMKYCDPVKKSCVDYETCPQETVTHCQRAGFFPHTIKPSSFVYCSGGGKTGVDYDCPTGYNYDSGKNICTKDKTNFADFSMKGLCKGKRLQYISHPNMPSLYTLCTSSESTLNIRMCNTDTERFDVDNAQCVYNCVKEGFVPNPIKAEEFCTCIKTASGLKAECAACAANGKFTNPEKFCEVDDSQQPQQPSP